MNIHGSMKFSWTNSLLYVQGTGPFNEEGMKEGFANYVNAILTKQFTNFSVIEIWDDEYLGSPKVMETLRDIWKILADNNCISIAIVVSNSLQEYICEKTLPPIGKVFYKKTEADIWIKTCEIEASEKAYMTKVCQTDASVEIFSSLDLF